MPKISKKPVYPQDTNVTMGDYLIGTNVNTSNLRTQTYSVESLINLANEVVGNSTSSYKFSIDPLVTHLEQGFFTSENNKKNPLEVTKLSFNRLTVQGINASSAFIFLVQSGFFTIKLKNVSDLNNIIYLAPSNLVQGTNFVTFNIANFASNGLLVDGDTYFLDYALKTAESINQDNKIKPIYVFMPESISFGDSEATYINSLINFEVKDFEIPLFIITQDASVSSSTFFTAFPAIRKYFLKEKGKGFYGNGGIQLTMSDLELVYEKFATVEEVINLPTTQFINIGDIGVSEIQDVVNLDNGYLIQEQSVGYRIFATIVNGTSVNYLFLAPGGIYGINLLQTVAADFQIFGDENAIVQINDTTPSLTEVYSSQKVEEELDLIAGEILAKQNTPRLVDTDTTALNNEILHVTDDATITDVVGAVAGNFYEVRVLGGVATVGSVAYQSGNIIKRSFNGTDWISRVYMNKAIIDLTYQVLDSDFLINANTVLSAIHNGKTLYVEGFCTITIPATLPADFKCCFKTKLGAQITWAITAPFVYAYGTPTATPELRDALITRELNTNNIYLTTN
jgi:hypothetical protein